MMDTMMKKKNYNGVACVTFLDRGQIDYLDKMSKDYFFKYGHKLPRSQILSELVNLMMHSQIDLSETELGQEGIWKVILKALKNEK